MKEKKIEKLKERTNERTLHISAYTITIGHCYVIGTPPKLIISAVSGLQWALQIARGHYN